MAITGFGLDGGDDPAFDYVVQAATGIAALTGDPDGPPTLPGYSSADNSTGLTAALGLLAQIVSGRGGQVDVSLRDVMLSQLNYRAVGLPQRRHRAAAAAVWVRTRIMFPRSSSRPPTATWRCSSPMTASGSPFAAEASIDGLPDDGRAGGAAATRYSPSWRSALATDTAAGWEARLRPLGVPGRRRPDAARGARATPEWLCTRGISGSSAIRSTWAGISRSTGPRRN